MKLFLTLLLSIFNLTAYSQTECFGLIYDQTSICSGQEFYIDAININQVSTSTFSWYLNNVEIAQGSNFSSFVVNEGYTDSVLSYIMKGDDGLGCVDFDTLEITVYPQPSIAYSVVNPLCPNVTGTASFGTVYVTSNQQISSLNYKSNIEGSFIQSNENDSISYLQTGGYQVYLTDNNNCSSDTVSITIVDPELFSGPSSTITQDDNCSQGTGKIVFFGLAGGTKPYSFSDYNSLDYINFNDSIIVGLSGGTHPVKLIDANGCEMNIDPSGVVINSFTNSKPDSPIYEASYTVCDGDSLLLIDSELSNIGLSHYYYFSGGISFRVSNNEQVYLTPLEASQDSVLVKTEGTPGAANAGCFSDSFTFIELKQVFCKDEDSSITNIVTNAFSPNSSLIENTTFKIDLNYVINEEVNDVKVKIYNRWGDVIKEFENYNNTSSVWHGDNLSGDVMPEGTYFYTLEVPSKNFSTSGWVYLNN
jgi:gliding motility-associated-like protein